MNHDWEPTGIDTQTPSTARMYDYYLGGKHHYPADREAAEQVLATVPEVSTGARENRKFLQRAVRHMAGAGIRQFLDLGTGLPTQENVHQVAQTVAPDARVVYVDNDPVALAHARALLANDAQTAVADADLRRPEQVLAHPEVTQLLDLTEPIGLLCVAVLHFVTDDDDPAGIVARYGAAAAPGSYLALSHGSAEHQSADTADRATQGTVTYQGATSPIILRGRERVRELFAGFELLDPGIVPVNQWRPDPEAAADEPTLGLAGLARKP